MIAPRRAALLALGLAAAAGCAGPRPVDEGEAATVALPEAAARERVERGLLVRGFTVLGRGDPITAVGTGPAAAARGWAECPALLLPDPARRGSRASRAEAGDVTTQVSVALTPVSAASTRVAVRARHAGAYVNRFTATPQQRPCASTGALERALLGALQA